MLSSAIEFCQLVPYEVVLFVCVGNIGHHSGLLLHNALVFEVLDQIHCIILLLTRDVG